MNSKSIESTSLKVGWLVVLSRMLLKVTWRILHILLSGMSLTVGWLILIPAILIMNIIESRMAHATFKSITESRMLHSEILLKVEWLILLFGYLQRSTSESTSGMALKVGWTILLFGVLFAAQYQWVNIGNDAESRISHPTFWCSIFKSFYSVCSIFRISWK